MKLGGVKVVAGIAFAGACAAHGPADVDTQRIIHADREPGNWMSVGRTYDEQRYSPLKQIDEHNVQQLGLAWYYDLNTQRGIEGTPIVVDGVLYATSAWTITVAIDAGTGKELWRYDPKVPPEWSRYVCCDVVSRGLAVWQGKVIIATHVSSYAGTDLLEMSDPMEEQRLPEIFDAVIRDLAVYNSAERQIGRIRFALDNTYARQVERVQQFITR